MPPISYATIGWHAVRIYLYSKVVKFVHKKIVLRGITKYVVLIALFLGTLVY